MIDDQELLEDDHGLYTLNFWPKKDVNSVTGFILKSDEDEFKDAVKTVLGMLKVKGREMVVRKVKFKTKTVNERAHFLTIYMNDIIYGEGHIHLKWTWDGKKGTSLHISKVKGCDSFLVKNFMFVLKYLVDGTMDDAFTPEMIASFSKGDDEGKDSCVNCNQTYQTATGLSLHQCSVPVPEPMEVTKQISSNEANDYVSAFRNYIVTSPSENSEKTEDYKCTLCQQYFVNAHGLKIHVSRIHKSQNIVKQRDDKVIDDDMKASSKPLTSKVSHDKGKIRVDKFINDRGAVLKRVVGDGACAPRAISLILFGTENHWRVIATAMNKKNRESFVEREIVGNVFYPFQRIVSGVGRKEFNNREEYLNFLETEESLYTWREGPDLKCISDLLEIKLIILVSGDGENLDGGKPLIIGEQFTPEVVLFLNKSSEHYFSVINPQNKNDNNERLSKLQDYINNVSAQGLDSFCSDEDVRRWRRIEKQMELLQSKLNFYEKELECQRNFYEKGLNECRSKIFILETNKCIHESPGKKEVFLAAVAANQSQNLPQTGQVNALPPASSPVPMEMDAIQDLQRLNSLKMQGFQRQSPQVAPLPKKPNFYCISCNVPFDTKDGLRDHNQICPKKKKNTNVEQSHQVDSAEKDLKSIPVHIDPSIRVPQNGSVREYNCHNCDFQCSGPGRSKLLLKHSKETGHKTDDLKEKCYTCGEILLNWEELMIHRKNQHRDRVKTCHYNSDCRWKDNCWFNHGSQDNNGMIDRSNQRGFQQSRDPFPPDQMDLLREMLTAFQLTKESQNQLKEKERSQGV